MEVEVYADLLFLINAGMDGLCLLLTGKLLQVKLSPLRVLLAALLGGIYAVVALFLVPQGRILSLSLDLVVCLLMCGMAFWRRRGGRKTAAAMGVYLSLSMALGGVMTALYGLLNRTGLASLLGIWSKEGGDGPAAWLFLLVTLMGAGVSLWGGRLFRRAKATRICTVSVTLNGKTVTLRGLVDSGNLLRDPLGGRAVICAREEALRELLSPSLAAVLRGESPQRVKLSPGDARRLRVIPASTATGQSLLYGFLPDCVTVVSSGGREECRVDAAIALTLIPTEGVEALLPSELIL